MSIDIEYPRIIHIMPATNIWIKYEDTIEKGKHFYCRATCLALMEDKTNCGQTETYIEYIDMDSHGYYEFSNSHRSVQGLEIVYSEKDLSAVID